MSDATDLRTVGLLGLGKMGLPMARHLIAKGHAVVGMPWAEKDMRITLHEADLARISLPVAGVVKEAIKDLKIRLGQPTPAERE